MSNQGHDDRQDGILPVAAVRALELLLADKRRSRQSQGTLLSANNNFHPDQVGQLGRPTLRVRVSTPGEQTRTPTEDDEHSRAHSRHSDFKSITTIDDFGFGIGLNQKSRSPSRHRASSESMYPHQSPDGTRIHVNRLNIQNTQDALNEVGAVFLGSPPAQPGTPDEINQYLDNNFLAHEDELLRSAYEDSMHEASNPGEAKEFLPLDKLVGLLDETKIRRILRCALPNESENIETLTSALHSNKHDQSRRMILAVLVLIRKVDCIKDFIEKDIRDIHLPLRRYKNKDKRFRHSVCFQKRNGSEVVYLPESWSGGELDSFISTQYRVLAPFFDMPTDDVHFYKIEDRGIILPFLDWEKKTSGGYGTVWKVKIHPAHHNFVGHDGSHSVNPCFAVKQIQSGVYEEYKQEIRVLERFSGPNPGHKHLIRLRLAFQYGTNYYLLFDWAHGNLIDLWKQTPNPTASPHLLRWLIRQCLGIADGLRKIHRHGSWSDAKTLDGSSHLEDADKNRGRHGDIKPENILCFETDEHQHHHLRVSDFGLTRFHSPRSVSRVPLDKVHGISRTYRSPEYDTQPYISQAYDMWGLGCLYLEFISWFLVGYHETREVFQSMRLREDIPPASFVDEDKFFNLDPQALHLDPTNPNNANVKRCVVDVSSADDLWEGFDAYHEQWIEKLQRQKNCSQCIRDFLFHIRDSLLVPNPSKRAKIDQFHTHLTGIYQLCEKRLGYCEPLQRSSEYDHASEPSAFGQPTVVDNHGEGAENLEELKLILEELGKLNTNENPTSSKATPRISEKTLKNSRIPHGPDVSALDTGRTGEPLWRAHTRVPSCEGEASHRNWRRGTERPALTHGESNLTRASSSGLRQSEDLSSDTPDTTQDSTPDDVPPRPETGERYSPCDCDSVGQPYRKIPTAARTAAEQEVHRGTISSIRDEPGLTASRRIRMYLKKGTRHPRADGYLQQGETRGNLQVLGAKSLKHDLKGKQKAIPCQLTEPGRTWQQSNGHGSSLNTIMRTVNDKSSPSSVCPETRNRALDVIQAPPTRQRKRDWVKEVCRKAFLFT